MAHCQIETIRFGILFEKLTAKERNLFLNNIVSDQQNILICALRYCVMHEPSIGKEFNSTLSRIIHAREENKLTRKVSAFTLDNIPQAVIGNCASFLKQVDYVNFSQTNRCIYMGCNDPNVLKYLDVMSKNVMIPSPVCRAAYSVNCEVNKSNYALLKNEIFAKVDTLRLFVEDEWYMNFLMLFDCKQVENLRLSSYDIEITELSFKKILSKFTNLKHLAFDIKMDRELLNDEDIPKLLCHLQGISILQQFVYFADILDKYASKWKYLQIRQCAVFQIDFSEYKFSELKEFRGQDLPETTLLNIIKSASKLRKISLNGAFQIQLSQNTVTHLFESCLQLEYLCFENYTTDTVVKILGGIAKGLLNTKEKKRKNFIICINFRKCTFTSEVNNFVELTCKILVYLEKYTENFIVVYDEHWFSSAHFDSKIKKAFPETMNVNVFDSNRFADTMVLSNKNEKQSNNSQCLNHNKETQTLWKN